MIVIWTPDAEEDRINIWDHISISNPSAAASMDTIFSDAAAMLSEHPKLGKAGKVAGIRELVPHENYRLVYEIGDDSIWILALMHTSRLWPPVRM